MGVFAKVGAVGGGAVGAVYGGPAGGMIGAGAGGALGGMLDPKDKVPKYSDGLLKKENPELWKELQRLRSITKEYDAAYSRRAKGATSSELIQKESALAGNRAVSANRGLAGSSAGAQMQADLENRLMAGIQERAMAEQERLMAGRQQAQAQYLQSLGEAQKSVMGPIDAQYAQDQADHEAMNGLYSQMFNAGMTMYGLNQQPGANMNDGSTPVDMGTGGQYNQYKGGAALPGKVMSNDKGNFGPTASYQNPFQAPQDRYMVAGYYPGGYPNPYYKGVG